MPIFHAVVLGIIQALTEFLPISSTAHLILVPWLLGWDDGGLIFDVALHSGTLVAILIFFRHEWILFAKGFLKVRPQNYFNPNNEKNPDGRLALFIIYATIPGAI